MNRRYPRYPDDADYQTNAPSYYEDLARKQKLIEMLAKKIWEYENTLNETLEQIEQRLTDYILENDSLMSERLENWDKRIEEMPEEMRSLFVTWLNDGTLEKIINHDVLGNKADQSELDKTNEQLARTGNRTSSFTPEFFGAIGDGITDDTDAIQRAFDSGYNITFKTGREYLLTQPTFITNDNVIIDFNDSHIHFKYDQTKPHSMDVLGIVNWVGAINVVGEELETFSINTSKGIDMSLGAYQLTTPVDTKLKKGDFVRVDIKTDSPSQTNLGFNRTIITKVIDVNNSEIITDYKMSKDKWNISKIDPSIYSVANLTKIKPVKNIQIRNFNMEDFTVLRNDWKTNVNNAYPPSDSHYAVAGIQLKYVYKPKLTNINIKNHLYSAVYSHYVHSGSFKNLFNENPRLYGPGEGYLIQNIGSIFNDYNNLYGIGSRHTVDFTTSAYCIANNINAEDNRGDEIQFHGVFEHDITFNHVNGNKDDRGAQNKPKANFGSGLSNFGNAVSHISFRNADLFIGSGRDSRFARNITVDQSNVVLSGAVYDIEFLNSEIYIRNELDSEISKRGLNEPNRIKFKNSLISWNMITEGINKFITDYDNVEFTQSEIVFEDNVKTTNAYLSLVNNKKVVINELTADLTLRPIQNKPIDSYFIIKDSRITRNHRGSIEIQNITDGTMKLIVSGNDLIENQNGSFNPIEFNFKTVTLEKMILYVINNMSTSEPIDYTTAFDNVENVEYNFKDNIGLYIVDE